jgi:transcriptional regulator with PAS, ATPase and Fis domain
MYAIRSVLWIGPASGLAESGALDQPTLDVTWVPNIGDALALEPATFDVEILDVEVRDVEVRDVEGSDVQGSERLLEDIDRLRRGSRRAPIIVRLPPDDARRAELATGERDVVSIAAAGAQAVEDLLYHVDRLADALPWQGPEAPEPEFAGVIGRSPAIREVLALVRRARDSKATVLLSGETGTGKEVIARALHESGPRAGRAFVAVNCAAFPDTLLESELFGHTRGAFTGADREKPGLFAEANGGTIFLDEIGETSGPLQATLLRVLQEREVRPVGSTRSRTVDVRVVAASNRSLRAEAARGFFREDLYYRLAVFPIMVPPLRERPEDILLLAEHFLELHGQREGKHGCRLARATAHLLAAHDWPGNVRELENEMQRALALSDPGSLITPKLLSGWVADILEPIRQTHACGTLRATMDRIEAWLIRRALEQHDQRRTATAKKLGITREGLYKKMKRLNVE